MYFVFCIYVALTGNSRPTPPTKRLRQNETVLIIIKDFTKIFNSIL